MLIDWLFPPSSRLNEGREGKGTNKYIYWIQTDTNPKGIIIRCQEIPPTLLDRDLEVWMASYVFCALGSFWHTGSKVFGVHQSPPWQCRLRPSDQRPDMERKKKVLYLPSEQILLLDCHLYGGNKAPLKTYIDCRRVERS